MLRREERMLELLKDMRRSIDAAVAVQLLVGGRSSSMAKKAPRKEECGARGLEHRRERA